MNKNDCVPLHHQLTNINGQNSLTLSTYSTLLGPALHKAGGRDVVPDRCVKLNAEMWKLQRANGGGMRRRVRQKRDGP